MPQGMELSGAVGHFLDLWTIPPLVLLIFLAFDTDEAMFGSSLTALAKEKERERWSIDLEGDMEKLEVVGPLSRTESADAGTRFSEDRRMTPSMNHVCL